MAIVINFKDRITDIAGTLTTTDDSALEQWVLDGCYDVVARVSSVPGLLERFTKRTTLGSSEVSLAVDDIRTIVGVDREGYPARRIPSSLRKDITLSGSMYYVNEDSDPVWYIHDGVLYVKPTVDGGGAFYEYIPEYTVTDFDHPSNTAKIADFPPDFYLHVLHYAAIQLIEREMRDMNNIIPESVSLPVLPLLPVAPTPIDTTATHVALPSFPTFNPPALAVDMGSIKPGAMYWLETEEDTELVSSALAIISKEIEIYGRDWEKANKEFEIAKNEYDKEVEFILKNSEFAEGKIGRDVAKFKDELTLYSSELTAYAQEVTKFREELAAVSKVFEQNMMRLKQKYEWLTGQLGILKMEYENLFAPGQKQGGQ